MGRQIIYTYQCDKCKTVFNSPNDVMVLKGSILNGDDEKIIEGNNEIDEYYCEKCFKKIYIDRTEKFENVCTEELEDDEQDNISYDNSILENYIILKKIDNKKELETFISYLGHPSLETFQKIYKTPETLLNAYYPIDIEDAPEINLKNMCYLKEINVIKHVLAGIPQITTLKAQTNKSEDIAIIERKIFVSKENG